MIEQYEAEGNPWFSIDTKARERYPDATSILLTCDCGGSNPAGKYLFKWDLQRVVELMRRTTTRSGLRTTVHVMNKVYQTGREAAEWMKSSLRITYDRIVPRWNYTLNPSCATI
ncbi:MAG: hypothetical protein R3C59_29255 [Planctomycetaceae bacterium]